jgi:hypothetical protein
LPRMLLFRGAQMRSTTCTLFQRKRTVRNERNRFNETKSAMLMRAKLTECLSTVTISVDRESRRSSQRAEGSRTIRWFITNGRTFRWLFTDSGGFRW